MPKPTMAFLIAAFACSNALAQPPTRHDFSKIKTAARIPNLIEIQRDSYNRFLQMDLLPEEREQQGQCVLVAATGDAAGLGFGRQ